jgi:hypothetical protein
VWAVDHTYPPWIQPWSPSCATCCSQLPLLDYMSKQDATCDYKTEKEKMGQRYSTHPTQILFRSTAKLSNREAFRLTDRLSLHHHFSEWLLIITLTNRLRHGERGFAQRDGR